MKARRLWQISVTTARESEEAVAALLERLFGQPASIYAGDGNPLSVATVYTPRNARLVLSKRKALESGLNFLSTCNLELGRPKVDMRALPPEDWANSWKKNFPVIEIGATLSIKPSWNRRKSRKGQATVTLDPGLSFGTGQHPTTAFCLGQLVKTRKIGHARSFLDIGSGSGILAIAAVKLGYQPVRAFDHDATAVRIARANARKNRVANQLRIVQQDLTRAPIQGRFQYDLVCANLVDDLLVEQVKRLVNRVRSGGRLVLAGVLASQFPAVQKTYERAGMRLETSVTEKGWESGAFVFRG